VKWLPSLFNGRAVDHKAPTKTSSLFQQGDALRELLKGLRYSKDYDIWAESDDQIEAGDELYFLLAAKVFENRSSSKQRDELWFIVLRLVDRPLALRIVKTSCILALDGRRWK
jgi:hypothetical protein